MLTLEKFGLGPPENYDLIDAINDKKKLDKLVQLDKPKKLGLFDYLTILTYSKKYLNVDTSYSAYMIDKALSNSITTITFAAQANRLRLSGQRSFDYYYYSIDKSSIKPKWPKLTTGVQDYILAGVLSMSWNCSEREASINLKFLSIQDKLYYINKFKGTFNYWLESKQHKYSKQLLEETLKNMIKG